MLWVVWMMISYAYLILVWNDNVTWCTNIIYDVKVLILSSSNKHGREPRTCSASLGRFGARRFGWWFGEFASTHLSAICACSVMQALERGPGWGSQSQKNRRQNIMHMEPESSQASAQQEKQEFVWNRSIMSSRLNIKIGDDEFFHPFPARTEMKIKSNDLYEK